MDVVILAAGASRRFGGEKQFTPVAPDGATLIEITSRNARRAGCNRAVVVTAPGREDDVKALFKKRPVDGLEIVIVYQKPDDLPAPSPVDRDRPWGTAHALWSARNVVTGPFLLFNADDDYGPNAPATLVEALKTGESQTTFFLLGYPLGETLSKAGTVSRALCETNNENMLVGLREYTNIDINGVVASDGITLPLDAQVSMNAWAFTPAVFPILENALRNYLNRPGAAQEECYLPAAVDDAVRGGTIAVRVERATDRWCGMTWPGDREIVSRRLADHASVQLVSAQFGLGDAVTAPVRFGDGLINDTWYVATGQGQYLVQRINSVVFPDPAAVATNAAVAARRVDNALYRNGDDDPRHRLIFRDAPGNRPWIHDSGGDVWRAAVFIPDARPANPTRPEEVRGAARALGRFPGLVEEGVGPQLAEVLPGFHDTRARLERLIAGANNDTVRRLESCRAEFDRLIGLAPLAARLTRVEMPVRPVHNDAKLDNVLVDNNTGEVLCVVDLDTAMPGFAVHDFGDLVRSAVTGCPEDEPDLDRIEIREATFFDLAAGYLEGARDWLTDAERSRLVDGAIVITYEQAVRFLADYLAGDSYFPVDDPGHNLRRTRAQLRLLEELLVSEDDMRREIDDI